MENAIQVSGLRKAFAQQVAIEAVSFHVKKGEIFGLLGPSGSGKTTTIKILTGELEQTTGDVCVLDTDASSFDSTQFKSKLGILSDNSALYERLTVYDNLKLFCKLYGAPLERIDVILDDVNLKNDRNKVVSKLSKGMKQRILLAKALVHQPDLVFLDEPTSALDPGNVIHIHRGLQKLNEAGTTIFLTTHDMEEATKLCDRVAFLDNGTIQELGNPDELRFKYSSHDFHIETTTNEKFVLGNDSKNADQIRDLIAAGKVKSIQSDKPTLGDVFLKLTGKELV